MRWEDLFADLEAQLDADEAVARRSDLAERSRIELSSVGLVDRLVAHRDHPLTVAVRGAGTVRGRLLDVASEWLLVEEPSGRTVLVPTAACQWLTGIGRRSEVQPERSLARRLGLASALRTLARQRVPVSCVLDGQTRLTGTFDRVHSDHADLAEHPADRPRRAGEVRVVRLVPFSAIALVTPA